ncbi:Regulatory protein MsrR [compost metagenome]
MKYTSKADNHEYDIDLKKGFQHLDGTTALQYVRFRHDAMSDYSRTERQRNFLTAVAEKMKTTTSIMKLPSILEKMNPYIDTNLSVEDMWKLATIGYSSQMSASEQIPPMELLVEKNIGGSDVLGVRDEDELKAYVQDVFNKKEEASNEANSGTPGSTSSDSSNNSATDNSPNGATSSEP